MSRDTVVAASPAFDDAWAEFIDATRRARGRFDPDRSGGLTLAQFHLLEPLEEEDTAPIGRLADRGGVTPPVATRMFAALTSAGLVERSADAQDARRVRVGLTDAGREAVAKKRRYVERQRRKIASALNGSEREQAAVLLRRLAEVIDEL